MDKTKEFEKLRTRCDQLLSRYNELSKAEVDELVLLTAQGMQLLTERHSEQIKTMLDRTEDLEQRALELELFIVAHEAFLMEQGLDKEFESFVAESISDFKKKTGPNLTLVQ